MSDLACTSMAEETPYKGPMVVRFYPGQPTERSIEMKYRITGPKDVEREVVLELVQERSSGEVRLTAQVDGNTWWIVKLTREGTLRRCEAISSDIGFQVDEKGRIKETSE